MKNEQTWKAKVKDVYASLEELASYDSIYGIARRCGFEACEDMWAANPLIGGSTDPKAFGLSR
jgi:hypothetical protein